MKLLWGKAAKKYKEEPEKDPNLDHSWIKTPAQAYIYKVSCKDHPDIPCEEKEQRIWECPICQKTYDLRKYIYKNWSLEEC